MVFLHGTSIMHRNALGVDREERVRQVMTGEESIYQYESYVPIGGAVEKLTKWAGQGAEIVYLSPHIKEILVEIDNAVLTANDFPQGPIFYRQDGETYEDIIEITPPDILIEDDCESIGGEKEMTHPNLGAELRGRVKSIVVKEFGGIDHLPDRISELVIFKE